MVNPFAYSFVATLMIAPCLQGKDLGTHGEIRHIEEKDPIEEIKEKLRLLQERGELHRHNQDLQQKTQAIVERPKPVLGITRASKKRIFLYDPTYIVKDDIVDHQGNVIHSKGERVNPLKTVKLSQDLIFFDGDDEEQLTFVKTKIQDNKDKALKLILVKGAPIELSKELNQTISFDQGGVLVKRLSIRHVPAIVTQEKLNLRIEEIALNEEKK